MLTEEKTDCDSVEKQQKSQNKRKKKDFQDLKDYKTQDLFRSSSSLELKDYESYKDKFLRYSWIFGSQKLYSSIKHRALLSAELNRLIVFFLCLVFLILLGSSGYYLIEEWTFFESLYMTIITIATVGFMEVRPLSVEGRVLTILLIILGFGLVTVLYSTIAQLLIQQQFLSAYRGKKMLDEISKLDQHTIFCGYGRLAKTAANELIYAGFPQLVVIEADEEKVKQARDAGHLVVEGDATTDEVLIKAGIKKAGRLVAVLPKDSDNLYVVLTSRELNPQLFIMTRAEDELGEKRFIRAGANRVISPYRVGGLKIAEGLLRPQVTDFIELAVSGKGGALQIEEIQIPDNTPFNGKTLQQSKFRKKTNVIVAAVISKDGSMRFNPDGDTVIEGGATFIVLGLRPDLIEMEKMLTG